MAMEKTYVVPDTHTRSITAIGYNPTRREILLGCEDGVVKTWEAESGKLVMVSHEHKGWVTDFLYWNDVKLMLSSANDGDLIAWSSGGGVADRISLNEPKASRDLLRPDVFSPHGQSYPCYLRHFFHLIQPIGMPVYCMAINPRRQQIVCGVNGGIRVYALDENKDSGQLIDNRVLFIAPEHTDIVRCIVCHESRIYSAGYDQQLVIYDSSYTGDNSLQPVFQNKNAHDAGISCLLLAKDNENNTWILTGSFDKTVKIWSVDGKPIHKLDNFLSTVSGICYVPRNKTVWAAGGTSYASLFDPKSGDNVSDFIGTFQTQEEEKYHLQIMKYFHELNSVVASSSRRHLIVWKYNSSGCITALKCKIPLESLCYTKKVPILIFSGDNDGVITKWERMQSNHFMYSKEMYQISDSKLKKKRRVGSKARELMLEQQLSQSQAQKQEQARAESSAKQSNKIQSHYAFNKPMIPPVSTHDHPNTTILKIVFVEKLDYILAASEDANIYVWGFDDDAVEALKSMKPLDLETLVAKYSILLDADSELLPQNNTINDSDSVTNRVAGFICKYIFAYHESCVTSLVVVGPESGNEELQTTYVLSGGWDRKICIWDLENGRMHDTFRNTAPGATYESLELACDGVIMDMDYSPKTKEFAYATSDKMVYIRKFSITGSNMTLVNTLQGHDGEVTCVRWNPIGKGTWVTGSEDGTIRIWSGSGLNECEQILSAQGGVCCLCIDQTNGSIVAGIQNFIRVYDPEHFRLVQTNVGHSDAVRSILHIPERNQYVSCSWDKTVRVWNAWKMPRRKRHRKQPENKTSSLLIGSSDDLLKLSTSGSEKKVEFADEAEIKDIDMNIDETTETEDDIESRSESRLTEEEEE